MQQSYEKKNEAEQTNQKSKIMIMNNNRKLFCKYCLVHVFTKAEQTKKNRIINEATTTKIYI